MVATQKSYYRFIKIDLRVLLHIQKHLQKNKRKLLLNFTGSSKNYEGLKAHLRYISRNGEVEVQSSDGCKFIGKSDLNILSESFNSGDRIPTQREIRDNSLKEQREAIHVVFL